MRTVLVTASDTGVGKTHVAGLLVRRLSRLGRGQAVKPVESGAGAGRPSDARRAAGRLADAITVLSLPEPLAPLAAARRAGRRLTLASLVRGLRALPRAPFRIIEGAGGVAVPLGADGSDWSDFAAAVRPGLVVIVVPDRLGAISQARTAYAYLRRRWRGPAGVWLNAVRAPSAAVAASNREGLRAAGIPLLGESRRGVARFVAPALRP
ncbi:MAG: ATP-dependent dethiobiotin synthetase BioD [Opitutia bacterium]